jgi:hypothetical protein
MPAARFKDHFSVAAHEYDRYRPGDPARPRPVRWPLHLRVGRLPRGHC